MVVEVVEAADEGVGAAVEGYERGLVVGNKAGAIRKLWEMGRGEGGLQAVFPYA